MRRHLLIPASLILLLGVVAMIGIHTLGRMRHTIPVPAMQCDQVEVAKGNAILTVSYPFQSYGYWDSFQWTERSGKLLVTVNASPFARKKWPARIRVDVAGAKITDVYLTNGKFDLSTAKHVWPQSQ